MKILRVMSILIVAALVLAACAPAATPAPEEPPAEEAAPTQVPAQPTAAPEEPVEEVLSLVGVCPDPVVIQTDWFPEAEHGALYEMVGEDYTIDTENKVVRGSLVASGVDTGIDIEVRTGGPAIGFQQPIQQMYIEQDIFLGYVSTNEAVFGSQDTPVLTVVTPLERNPQIIMWDPATYPDVKTIADLGKTDATIQVFAGGNFIDVFIAEGIVKAEQIDPSYDGSPARWVASNGAVAQQGFATAEPFIYEFELEEWGKPVAFELLHDAGFEIYSQTLAIRKGELEQHRACLELLVPIVQQAVVDYITDPVRANAIIVDAVETYQDFWVYSPELAEYSAKTQLELGLVGNGPDNTIANMELSRVQGVIDQMIAAGLPVQQDLKAEDILTNEFIDESIGLP